MAKRKFRWVEPVVSAPLSSRLLADPLQIMESPGFDFVLLRERGKQAEIPHGSCASQAGRWSFGLGVGLGFQLPQLSCHVLCCIVLLSKESRKVLLSVISDMKHVSSFVLQVV